jgi:hypothetical protein
MSTMSTTQAIDFTQAAALGIEEFAAQAVSTARRMGETRAEEEIKRLTDNPVATPQDVHRHLVERLVQGPDDSWSGRTNDLKRAYFEGYTAYARRTIEAYLYGMTS